MTTNALILQTGQPSNGEATVRINDGPPLTHSQLVGVLVAGGLRYERAIFAAKYLLQGTAYPQVVHRTAQDAMNEYEVARLKEDKSLLLRALRAKLSPLWGRALTELSEDVGMTSAMLAARLSVSLQQGANICSSLLVLGLVERQHIGSPHPDFTGPGRTPYWWKAVRAVREDS